MNKKNAFKWNICNPGVSRVFLWFGIILLFICLAFPGEMYAQEQEKGKRTCGTMNVHEKLMKTYPAYKRNRMEIEKYAKLYKRVGAKFKSVPVIIPVVVHVVHNTAAQNISDAQINSQIDVLNEDYRKLNADFSSAPAVFQAVAADARIQFRLAVRDPDCNPTTGITRTSTTVTSFTDDDAVKFAASGGHDAWPRDKYLNIWVCNLSPYLGYAQFPGGPANTDGVVITYTAFGNTGTASSPFDLGRTTTHEIGHWLNLFHIWGDDCPSANQCAGSDQVADTPNQECMNFDCPTFPHISCSNGPNGDMFVNYMDYVDDNCMVMFTAGQSNRMDAALFGVRAAILGSDGLIPPPAIANPDLWSQDKPDDIGDEPNTISSHMYVTRDIWVRKQNDGFANQEHENPEYRPLTSDPNYVYVRIRNRGCTEASSGTVKLYWAKASTALGWPAPWDGTVIVPALMGDSIGNQPTGNIAGGEFVILEFPWYPPNPADYSSFGADKSHFCLLSRIETSATSPFGMTFPEGPGLSTNVRNNNNIVWKNITVVDEVTEGARVGWVTVGNILKSPAFIKFLFNVALEKEGDKSIFEFGTVTVDLGDKLFQKWKEGDAVAEGVEETGDNAIKVLKEGAHIGNIKLEPNELHTINIRFKPFKEEDVENEIFKLNLTQYQTVDGKDTVTGGQQFVFKPVVEHEAPEPEPAKPPLCWIIVIILVVIIIILLIIIIFRKPKR
jgi:hypothetical protein